MTGAARHPAGDVAEPLDGRLHQRDHPFVEGDRLEPGESARFDEDPFRAFERAQELSEPMLGLGELCFIGIAQVYRHCRPGCDDVDEVGVKRDQPDCADMRMAHFEGQIPHKRRDPGRRVAGVVAHRHGGRTRMVGFTGDREFLPRDALNPCHSPEADAFDLQHGTLLNMQFDERERHLTRARGRAEIANARQLLADLSSVDSDDIVSLLG